MARSRAKTRTRSRSISRESNIPILKVALAELIAGHFAKFREKKKKLLAKPAAIKKILAEGSKKAGAVAVKKMAEVKKKVGL